MRARANRLAALRRCVHPEALIWALGLAWLAFTNPAGQSHFTLFLPYYLFGIRSPGYNLGHSVAYLFRGDVAHSLQAHWLGIPAVLILGHRIVSLTVHRIRSHTWQEVAHG